MAVVLVSYEARLLSFERRFLLNAARSGSSIELRQAVAGVIDTDNTQGAVDGCAEQAVAAGLDRACGRDGCIGRDTGPDRPPGWAGAQAEFGGPSRPTRVQRRDGGG